jgi:hypothetical protein
LEIFALMMHLEVKPNRWDCLATSFAMALNITTDEFHRLAGHDGSEILFPLRPEPQCRRGFHIQEAVNVARKLKYTATPFQLFPQLTSGYDTPLLIRYDNDPHLHHNWDLFKEILAQGRGVIECETSTNNNHAVAFENNYILDPDGGFVFPYSREACESRGLYTRCLWQIKQ